MKTFNRSGQIYSLYMTEGAIELRAIADDIDAARHICSQKNYENILDFGNTLAKRKNMPFVNYLDPPPT